MSSETGLLVGLSGLVGFAIGVFVVGLVFVLALGGFLREDRDD